METIFVSSKYFTPSDFIKHLPKTKFKSLSEKQFDKTKTIDFLYFDHTTSKSIKEKIYQKNSNYTSALRVTGPNFTDKGKLHKWLEKYPKLYNQYFMKQEYYSPNSIKQFNKKLVIVKPIPGFAGLGVKVFQGTSNISKYINNFKKPKNKEYMKDPQEWLIQEYIDRPLLLEGRKFHMRLTLLSIHPSGKSTRLYMHKHMLMFPAKFKYNTKSLNMNIHNTHGELTESHEKRLFPRDFTTIYGKDKMQIIQKQILKMLKELNKKDLFKFECFSETKIECFEFYGLDIMITNDFKIKCIEINHKPGLKRFLKHMPNLIKGLLDLTILKKDKTKDYIKI